MTSNRQSDMIPVAEARRRLLAGTTPVPAETVDVPAAAGRVLAVSVVAQTTQPPFAASAMDGYAVRGQDVADAPVTLTVIGEAPAGAPYIGRIEAGQAVRIFTGGVMPEGADTVVIQEDTEATGDTVTIEAPQKAGRHVRAAGIDFREGDTLLPAGTVVDGPALALAAAGNVPAVSVRRRPRLALLATGDELVPPGSVLQPGQIVNSICPGLAALAAEWGAEIIHVGHAPDDSGAILAELDAVGTADVAIVIGGASVGKYDLVKSSLAERGLETDFEKVAVRPGKPVWTGRLGGTRFLGLPGNPASALVCAYLFLKPLLWALTGRNGERAVRLVNARLEADLGGNGSRDAYLRARLRLGEDGLTVTADPRQDSSLLSPFGDITGLLMRPANAPAAGAGEIVPVLPIRGVSEEILLATPLDRAKSLD